MKNANTLEVNASVPRRAFSKQLKSRARLALCTLCLAAVSACGGGSSDDDDSTSNLQQLWGYWYSASTNVLWQFSSTAGSGDRHKGVMWQGSTDGSACRITYLDYSINSSGSTVTYYITRAVGTGTNNTYDSGTISDGPYSAGYAISGSSATIGNGTYSRSSGSRPRGC